MSKRVLILSASPRKHGNSDLLCDQFMTGALEAGHQVEKIFLRDKTIHYCLGCGACQGNQACVQKDDMAEILDKMVQADAIAMATPVYFYCMNAQLKTLIDRTVPRYTALRGKEFHLIATAADGSQSAMDETIAGFRGFLRCLPDPIEAGIVYGTGAWQVGEIKGTPAMQQAYEMGKRA